MNDSTETTIDVYHVYQLFVKIYRNYKKEVDLCFKLNFMRRFNYWLITQKERCVS